MRDLSLSMNLLESLGFLVNYTKSAEPLSRADIPGFHYQIICQVSLIHSETHFSGAVSLSHFNVCFLTLIGI